MQRRHPQLDLYLLQIAAQKILLFDGVNMITTATAKGSRARRRNCRGRRRTRRTNFMGAVLSEICICFKLQPQRFCCLMVFNMILLKDPEQEEEEEEEVEVEVAPPE